jgi:hypothetical protein
VSGLACGKYSSAVGAGEVSVAVVQPDADRLARNGHGYDDVEVAILIDVRRADRERIMRGFERDVVGSLSR